MFGASSELASVMELGFYSFWRPFGKPVALSYRTVVCLVTLVCCGQTAGWIRIPLGTMVGISLGDIVLDGDPIETGTAALTFRPTLLWHGRPSQQLPSSCT